MSGLSDKIAGKAKQVIGVASDDKELEGEGKGQEAKGDLKQKATDALDKAGYALEDLKKKIDTKQIAYEAIA